MDRCQSGTQSVVSFLLHGQKKATLDLSACYERGADGAYTQIDWKHSNPLATETIATFPLEITSLLRSMFNFD
jgi:hypothetical protein